MLKYLSLTLPGNQQINPDGQLPTGGVGILNRVIQNFLSMALIGGIVLSLFYLILGAMKWIMSGGDKGKIAAARAHITFSIIGLLVVLLSFGIIAIFGNLFGVDLLRLG